MMKTIKIILVLLCMISIFILSSDNADESNVKSNTIIYKIGELVTGRNLTEKEKEEAVEKFIFIVRKGAHFTIYLILGFLILNLLIEYKILDFKTIMVAILITSLYACSDEIHQLFVPGRSGEIRDVLIDTCGGVVGVIIYSLFYKLRRKMHE